MASTRTAEWILERARAGEGATWLVHRGGSMAPALREGDRLLVEPVAALPERGAIVVTMRGPRLVAHRVLEVRGDVIRTRGDACADEDPLVPLASIVGCVRAVERGGRRVAVGRGPGALGRAIVRLRRAIAPRGLRAWVRR